MKSVAIILALACCGTLQQAKSTPDFVPQPRSGFVPEPRDEVFPEPRNVSIAEPEIDFVRTTRQASSQWQAYSFRSFAEKLRLTSTNYPRSYYPGELSQVMFYSPAGSVIVVNCPEINVESSTGCTKDAMFFSPAGRTDFADAVGLCGSGSYSLTSTSNRLAFKFFSKAPVSSKAVYRFSCSLSIRTVPPTASTAAPAPVATTTTAPVPVGPSGGSTCSCGARNEMQRIVGGTYANKHEFPWRCVLYTQRLGAFCGASVIDSEWVMTAAHCTAALKSSDKLKVDCGDHDLSTTAEAKNQMRDVDYYKQHPQYSTPDQNNDIALLHLSQPLTIGSEVSPICLPWKQEGNQCKNAGTSVWASGWGTTKYQGNPSMTLKKVELPCMSSQECARYYGKAISNNMICTLKSGEDTCQGDSGGSIDYKEPSSGRYYALGVVSWGDECAKVNKPGVYTNVVNYLDWIKTTTSKTFCGQ